MTTPLWRGFLGFSFVEVLFVGWTGLPESWPYVLVLCAWAVLWNFVWFTAADKLCVNG